MINEKHLLKEIAQGSKNAFAELFQIYYPRVLFFIKSLVKSEEIAKDLTQDVFMKVWIERQRFGEVNLFGAFLFTISKNTVFDFFRASKMIQVDLNEEISQKEGLYATPYEELVRKDTQLLIDMVVDSMPKQRQTVYRLSRELGLSNSEIAEKLQIAKKTVENHLNLSLKELKNLITCLIMFYNS